VPPLTAGTSIKLRDSKAIALQHALNGNSGFIMYSIYIEK
jgi:hypothetical protein